MEGGQEWQLITRPAPSQPRARGLFSLSTKGGGIKTFRTPFCLVKNIFKPEPKPIFIETFIQPLLIYRLIN